MIPWPESFTIMFNGALAHHLAFLRGSDQGRACS